MSGHRGRRVVGASGPGKVEFAREQRKAIVVARFQDFREEFWRRRADDNPQMSTAR